MSEREYFWIGVGDIHGDIGRLSDIPRVAEADGLIVSGDMTNAGRRADAEKVLAAISGVNPVVYAQIGNMDYGEIEGLLDEKGVNIHARGFELAPGLGLIGLGGSTPTPFSTPSEFSEEQCAQWLEAAHQQVKHLPRLLLVAHTPPFDTKTDRIGAGVSVGSKAVRAFIERVQPDVCLTGHIHEAVASDTLGRTTVINPGALSAGGYAVIAYGNGRLTGQLRLLA